MTAIGLAGLTKEVQLRSETKHIWKEMSLGVDHPLVGDQYHDLETIIIYYCDQLVGRGVVSASLILVWIYLNQELQKHVLLKEVNLFQYSLKSITGHIAHAESHHLFHYESRSHQR